MRTSGIVIAGLVAAVLFAAPARAQTTFNVTNNGLVSYNINGSANPTLTLMRGQTYQFAVEAIGHPFWIKTVPGIGTTNAYNDGVTNNGTQLGTITFVVPLTAPSTLYYNCQIHAVMTGTINITGPTPSRVSSWGMLKARYR